MSVVHVPEANKDEREEERACASRQQVVSEVSAALADAIDDIGPEEGEDLGEIEHRVQQLLRPVGAALVGRASVHAVKARPSMEGSTGCARILGHSASTNRAAGAIQNGAGR